MNNFNKKLRELPHVTLEMDTTILEIQVKL